MTIRQLEVFLGVAQAQSFSRAAERIHLSQPTLSEHMRELEEELGVPLFVRHARSVSLSEAGRIFSDYATRVVATLAAGKQALAELDGLKRGSLVVGASTTPGTYLLPALIARFRDAYPGITVALRIANSRLVEERVRDGEVDVAVIGGHMLGPGERCVAAGIVDELRPGRLRVVAVEKMKIRRHFHVIHDERRPLSTSARAFVSFLEQGGREE